jgi:hypothetical protein
MLVWKAMPSITVMMSAIFLLLSLMPFMVSTTWLTISPPRSATVLAPIASWLACWALSAFCLTVEPSCSIEAAVSSSALACSSVRWLRSALPLAICAEPVAMLSLLLRTVPTILHQALIHVLQGAQQATHFVGAGDFDARAQVTGGHFLGNIQRLRHRAGDAAHQEEAKHPGKQQAPGHGRDRHRADGGVARFGLIVGLLRGAQLQLNQLVRRGIGGRRERVEAGQQREVRVLKALSLEGSDDRHHAFPEIGLALVGKLLGQSLGFVGHVAGHVGLPQRRDPLDIGLDRSEVPVDGVVVHLGERAGLVMLQPEQELGASLGHQVADFTQLRQRDGVVLIHRLERSVGAGDAEQAQAADDHEQSGQQPDQDHQAGGDLEMGQKIHDAGVDGKKGVNDQAALGAAWSRTGSISRSQSVLKHCFGAF